jgi:hypothetical protein
VARLRAFLTPWTDRVEIAYDPSDPVRPVTNQFYAYALAFERGLARQFWADYPFDVSPVTDDRPFFFKQYKMNDVWGAETWNYLFGNTVVYGGPGIPLVLVTQCVLLVQSLLLAIILIGAPLVLHRIQGLQIIQANRSELGAAVYLACLGVGFMLIEVALIQKTTLFVGAPQYAFPLVIAALLVGTGVGSLLTERPAFDRHFMRFGGGAALGVIVWLAASVTQYDRLSEALLQASLFWRATVVAVAILPLGLCLGVFFPLGLRALGRQHSDAISWAWAVNVTSSVVGTSLSLIISQFVGFTGTLGLAAGLYAIVGILVIWSRKNFLRFLA